MTRGFITHTGCTKNVCIIQYLSLIYSDLVLLSNEEFWAIGCINNGQNSTCFRNKNCLTSKEMDVPMEISTFGAQGSSPRTLADGRPTHSSPSSVLRSLRTLLLWQSRSTKRQLYSLLLCLSTQLYSQMWDLTSQWYYWYSKTGGIWCCIVV